MFSEAHLDVALHTAAGTVSGITVHSTRLVQAARLFVGRRPDEVTRLLPTIFALCGTAQVLAGLAAMEQASNLPPSAAQASARRLLLLAETVGEHGMGLARDWPMMAGAEPNLVAARTLKAAQFAIRPALYPSGEWTRPGGGALAPDFDALRGAIANMRGAITTMLGQGIETIVAASDCFLAWATPTGSAPARLVAEVAGSDLAAFGRGPFLPMPEQGPADLAARLAGDHDGSYVARPDSAGRVFETGPLARVAWHPLAAALLHAHGAGLLARLAARLVEVAAALAEMEELLEVLGAEKASAACLLDGAGLGMVEAARGLLVHAVELSNGTVSRYQILAPTEWNFHPQGPLVRGLNGAPATPDLTRRARLLALALDPCVACQVSQDESHA